MAALVTYGLKFFANISLISTHDQKSILPAIQLSPPTQNFQFLRVVP